MGNSQAQAQGWRPPFDPMTMAQLLQRLHEERWPSVVMLHPIDFAAIIQQLGVTMGSIHRDPDSERAFIWFANTKIGCAPAEVRTLDLSAREPSRIVSPVLT